MFQWSSWDDIYLHTCKCTHSALPCVLFDYNLHEIHVSIHVDSKYRQIARFENTLLYRSPHRVNIYTVSSSYFARVYRFSCHGYFYRCQGIFRRHATVSLSLWNNVAFRPEVTLLQTRLLKSLFLPVFFSSSSLFSLGAAVASGLPQRVESRLPFLA